MRGEASRIADRESRDSLAPKLRDTREDAWRIGNELFTITKVLDDSIQLERALTDPSRPVADKVAVLKELLGDNAHPMTMEIMTDLVSRRWSRARDIANAVEDFGVDAMMYYADATDATLQVSIELSELHSALLNLPVVRAKLAWAKAQIRALRARFWREVRVPGTGAQLNQALERAGRVADFLELAELMAVDALDRPIDKSAYEVGDLALGGDALPAGLPASVTVSPTWASRTLRIAAAR